MKGKQFTVLNVLGLSAGLACSLLIFLWASDEFSVDKFFANDDRLYRLMEGNSRNGETVYSDESSGRLSEAVRQNLPEVEYTAAIAPAKWFAPNTLSANDKNIKAGGQYAERDYFNIFSFQLLDGDKNLVLAARNSIVLSDELATKIFATTKNLIGKAIRFDHDTTFYVSGIFKKVPANSSQQFDFVLSFDYFKTVKEWVAHWNSGGPQNFVLLKKGTNIHTFNKKVENIITVSTGDTTRKVKAAKFSDGYLYRGDNDNGNTSGRIEYVNLFSALAIFILIIACINFMNLSTAKAAGRLKEVGVKKAVGATRSQLIVQFLSESFLLTLFAMAVAIGIAALLLPQFNQLTGKSIVLHFTGQMFAAVIAILLITSFLAGSYPALYISGFNPLAILKGKLRTSAAELLSRKGLVVFQFTLSTILIIAVIVIYQQVQYIRNVKLGYNKENIVRVTAEGKIQKDQDAFLSELQRIPGVVNAAYTYHNIVGRKYSDGLDWPGKDPERVQYFEVFGVSQNFIETMDMQVKAGRSFSEDFAMDSRSVILNEAAVKAMELKDPVGSNVRFHGMEMRVIGVVRNFHFESMHESIKPAFLHLLKGEGTILARIRQDNQKTALASIEKLYKRYNPGFPFTFSFLDEAYQKQFERETRTAALSGYFAGLAIIISCLGLFGLAAFTAQKRRKEIGVRKVIGASVVNITTMLSKDFLRLIFISLAIALPISWWLMNNWVQSFAYRISISPYIFVLAGISVILVTLFTISFQAIKAAIANPVNSLRTE